MVSWLEEDEEEGPDYNDETSLEQHYHDNCKFGRGRIHRQFGEGVLIRLKTTNCHVSKSKYQELLSYLLTFLINLLPKRF